MAYRRQYGCDFISAMPTNLYGPGDNFDLDGSHVLPALMRKFHDANLNGIQVAHWGTHDIEGSFQTVPSAIAKDFRKRFGDDPVGQCDYGG